MGEDKLEYGASSLNPPREKLTAFDDLVEKMSKDRPAGERERKWLDDVPSPEQLSIYDLGKLPIGDIVFNSRTGQSLIIEETERLGPGSFHLKTRVMESPGPGWYERLLRRLHISSPPRSDIKTGDSFIQIGTGNYV